MFSLLPADFLEDSCPYFTPASSASGLGYCPFQDLALFETFVGLLLQVPIKYPPLCVSLLACVGRVLSL